MINKHRRPEICVKDYLPQPNYNNTSKIHSFILSMSDNDFKEALLIGMLLVSEA